MKHLIFAAFAATGVMLLAAPASAACSACAIQTKVPSTTEAGKFDYRITCIDDNSGDEITSDVTAANDDEATELAKKPCEEVPG